MTSNEKTEELPRCSDPQPIPKEPTLRIDNTAQFASFVSQRSSSIDTFGSDSPTNGCGEYFPGGQDEKTSSLLGATSLVENQLAAGDGSACEESDSEGKGWLCTTGAMPVTMLHPSHRSTPVKNNEYLPTGGGGGDGAAAAPVRDEEEEGETNERSVLDTNGPMSRNEVFMLGDLHAPITGYETMEARSKFTVYKIQVQKAALSESEQEPESAGWFIFRRYSDFLHLNERLKHLFPGFRLSLPPKRWFRDNFDQNFLEDRMLGLQAFLTNITGHKDICNSEPVRAFFCTDEPPGPHDSLEESRALCDTLEESIYTLRQDLLDKDAELALLKEEMTLYKSQVEILSSQLKAVTGTAPVLGKSDVATPTSQASVSSNSDRSSLADCDNLASVTPASDEVKSETPEVQDSQ